MKRDNYQDTRQFIHDLSNKITALMGQVHILVETPEVAGTANKLSTIVQKIQGLIHTFKIHMNPKNSNVDLQTVTLCDRVELFEKLAYEVKDMFGIELDLRVPFEEMTVPYYSNIENSEVILQNIIHNAHKASATKIIVDATLNDATIDIHFRDNGKGMAANVLKKIGFGFTKGGTGEGVPIIREQAHKMGGIASWKSIEGLGTEVTLTLRRNLNGIKKIYLLSDAKNSNLHEISKKLDKYRKKAA